MSENQKPHIKEKVTKIQVKITYTDKQLLEMGTELTSKMRDKDELQATLSRVQKQYKNDIKRVQAEVSVLVDNIVTRYYFTDLDCFEIPDFDHKVVSYIRCDTCEFIRERIMRPEELQLKLDLEVPESPRCKIRRLHEAY